MKKSNNPNGRPPKAKTKALAMDNLFAMMAQYCAK